MKAHFANGSGKSSKRGKVVEHGKGKSPTRCDRDACGLPLIDSIGGTATCSRGHKLSLVDILSVAVHKGLFKGLKVAETAGAAGVLIKLRRDLHFLPVTDQHVVVRCDEVGPHACDGIVVGKKLGPIEKKSGIESNRGGIVHVCIDRETHFAPLLPLVRAYITKRSCADVFELGGVLTDKVVALAIKEQSEMDRLAHDLEVEDPEASRQARAHAKRERHAGQGRPAYIEAHI